MMALENRRYVALMLAAIFAAPALAQEATQESETLLTHEERGKLIRCAAGWGCENMAQNKLEAQVGLGLTEEQAQAEAREYGFEEPLLDDVILQCASGFDCLVEDLSPKEAAKLLSEKDAALQCAAGYGCEHTALTEENAQKMLDMSAEDAKAKFKGRVNTSGGQMRPSAVREGYEFSEKDLTPKDFYDRMSPKDMKDILDSAPKQNWGNGQLSFYEKCVEWMLEHSWSKIPAYQVHAIQSCKEAAKRGEPEIREDWKRIKKDLRENGVIHQ